MKRGLLAFGAMTAFLVVWPIYAEKNVFEQVKGAFEETFGGKKSKGFVPLRVEVRPEFKALMYRLRGVKVSPATMQIDVQIMDEAILKDVASWAPYDVEEWLALKSKNEGGLGYSFRRLHKLAVQEIISRFETNQKMLDKALREEVEKLEKRIEKKIEQEVASIPVPPPLPTGPIGKSPEITGTSTSTEPKMSAGFPAEPPAKDPKGEWLEDIRKGITLKSADERGAPEMPLEEELSSEERMRKQLEKAMESRRKAMREQEIEEESEEEFEEEDWD